MIWLYQKGRMINISLSIFFETKLRVQETCNQEELTEALTQTLDSQDFSNFNGHPTGVVQLFGVENSKS